MNKKLIIGIVGFGYVGKAVDNGFKDIAEIRIYDIKPELCKNSFKDTVLNSDFVFVCVPTNMKKDGSCDTSIVENVASMAYPYLKFTKGILVIKSTITPSTTSNLQKKYKDMRIVMNPEFLREATYLTDFLSPDRIIIGGNPKDTSEVRELYKLKFQEVPIIETTPTIAEMVKYTNNAFLSTKVLFFNEIWEICQALGCDYDKVKSLVLLDKRIGKSHANVPGFHGMGISGTCLPKDLNALIKKAIEIGINPIILLSILEKNLEVREEGA